MSRWIQSVNSLLHNLDGKAEEVANDGQALQKIIGATGNTLDEGGESTDGDEDYYEEDQGSEVESDNVVDFSDDNKEEELLSKESLKEDNQQPVQSSSSAVSDISFSTESENSIGSHDEKSAKKNVTPEDPHVTREDIPPQAPNRHASVSEDLRSMVTTTQQSGRIQEKGYESKFAVKTLKLDESPRFPRRSVENVVDLPPAGTFLLEGEGDVQPEVVDQPAIVQRPRRPPPVAVDGTIGAVATKEQAVTSLPPSIPSRAPMSNPKVVKENQNNAKEKIQALTAQLTKATNELKTSQTQVQSLTSQISTLETKLDVANAEIQAQSEELRRAGERMEKDRLRAQEEREDLLDEQEEELEQLHQTHKVELERLRHQFESQIAELTNQLHTEETKRRQEGGDYTQELQDAIERERMALKQLSSASAESTQLHTTISRLEKQQSSLQTKLDVALQSAKTASQREQEAEDKLDAAMTLHSRQTRQRQAREAELEKTIFELGTALTVARQKQQVGTLPSTVDSSGESFKEKYTTVAEEVETLKVQLRMETQRREALQEELNEIAKERSEEISSSQARQRMQDRKASEMEMTIARLKAQVREQRSKPNGTGSAAMDPVLLSREVEETRREIESLSVQLLRQQDTSDNFKSEILALKGRLQATTSRAEEAEKSLQMAQTSRPSGGAASSRLYEMEGGGIVGGMRRRVKGGSRARNATSIRAALQMTPGRTSSPIMEQVAITLDALDSWMVETGSFLRHEPLARLAFMLYLITLHLWSFALVVFHTAEEPHADFGSMDTNPRHWRAAAAPAQHQV